MDNLSWRLHVDGWLLLALVMTSVIGLVVLYSASHGDIQLVQRQGLRLGLGFGLLFVMAQVPPYYLRFCTPGFFLLGIVLLLAVLMLGESAKGAQRWLDLGVVRFQPSEIMKLALPLMLVWYLAQHPLPPRGRQIGIAIAISFLPCLLIALQPDLGTALMVGCCGFFVLFLSGLSWKILLGFGSFVGAAVPLLWHFGMRPYQRERVLAFLNPETDPLGSGYQIIQAQIAIGSGGLYGKGWLNGTQSQLAFLPEGSTDFVFAVLAEEFGLLGVGMLLLLYLVIIARGLYRATQAADNYGRLLAGSLALMFFTYVFVNMAMACGLMPVVGVPLPLVSYGGTSLVTMLAGFGMLMDVSYYRRGLR